MLTALIIASLATPQETPSFRELERLKFEALHQIEQGKLVWQGVMKGTDRPESRMTVELMIKGNSIRTEVHANGEMIGVTRTSPDETMFVSFADKSYGQYPYDEKQVPRAEEVYQQPTFLDGAEFTLANDGPQVMLGTTATATFVDRGKETIDGTEYDWILHEFKTEQSTGRVKQWFITGKWIVYKMSMVGSSTVTGDMDAEVILAEMDVETPIKESDLEIDPSLYSGFRRAIDPSRDPKWNKEPREGLPDSPTYDEIEDLKIDAMRALTSGRFRYSVIAANELNRDEFDAKIVFKGDSERVKSWKNGQLNYVKTASPDSWHVVTPDTLSYTIDRPSGEAIRSKTEKTKRHTELFEMTIDGVHLFTGYVSQSLFLDFGEQTVDGTECVWYLHRVASGANLANVKQWFKKGTWLLYQADVELFQPAKGELNITVRLTQFEPSAEVEDFELLTDPGDSIGYRLTSPDNPTGLGRTALDSDTPSYHAIEKLKYKEFLDLDSGKFAYEYKAKLLGKTPEFAAVQYVFRGDDFLQYSTENGERVNDSSGLDGETTYVFHKLDAYMVSQTPDWHRDGQELEKATVNEQSMKFRLFGHGFYVFINENQTMNLVGSGEETINGTECVWFEHELEYDRGGFIVRQWFKKDTWLLVKLESRVISSQIGRAHV